MSISQYSALYYYNIIIIIIVVIIITLTFPSHSPSIALCYSIGEFKIIMVSCGFRKYSHDDVCGSKCQQHCHQHPYHAPKTIHLRIKEYTPKDNIRIRKGKSSNSTRIRTCDFCCLFNWDIIRVRIPHQQHQQQYQSKYDITYTHTYIHTFLFCSSNSNTFSSVCL